MVSPGSHCCQTRRCSSSKLLYKRAGARPFPHNRLVLIHRLDPNLLGDANRHYEQARRLLALHKCSTPKKSLSRLLRMRWQAQANVLMASLSVLLRLLLEQMQGFSGSTTCSSLLA